MKLLILGNTDGTPTQDNRDYYQSYVDYFTDSAKMLDETTIVQSCLFDDLIISVGDGEFSIYDTLHQCDLSEYDAFFLRGVKFRDYMDTLITINHYANLHGIKTINDYSHGRDYSKLLQAVQFQLLDIPVARTLLVTGALLKSMPSDWAFPCIMKSTHGSHGNDNHLVANIEQVENIIRENSNKRFVLQRFVPNDGDFRILIIGNEVMVIGRSALEGSHLNNTSKGGDAVVIDTAELPGRVIDDSKKIMKQLHMTIAGVDVLMDKQTKDYYFLEVNAQPQLMSGAVVSEKKAMMGRLLDRLSNER